MLGYRKEIIRVAKLSYVLCNDANGEQIFLFCFILVDIIVKDTKNIYETVLKLSVFQAF